MMMEYPIELRFKLLALRTKISIRDGRGQFWGMARQAFFKLKEKIEIFGDEEAQNLAYLIEADRILDFSANYQMKDVPSGRILGSVRRRGMRSIWRASYEIYDATGAMRYEVREENAWVKVMDSVFGQIPILGVFSGYFFQPKYLVNNAQGQLISALEKSPAFFEGKFLLNTMSWPVTEDEQTLIILSLLMVTILERSRG